MADWMIFPDFAAAAAAVATIDANMNLSPDGAAVTTTWAVPAALADGRWATARPEERFLGGVVGFVVERPVWPPDPEPAR
jgi:hypothetical protein